MRRSRKIKFLFILIAALVAILTSCSDDGDSNKSDSTSETTEAIVNAADYLQDPNILEYCDQQWNICADFPTMDTDVDKVYVDSNNEFTGHWQLSSTVGIEKDSDYNTLYCGDPAPGECYETESYMIDIVEVNEANLATISTPAEGCSYEETMVTSVSAQMEICTLDGSPYDNRLIVIYGSYIYIADSANSYGAGYPPELQDQFFTSMGLRDVA